LTHGINLAKLSPMKTVNTHEAKSRLSRLLTEVERGEEIVVARAGRPVAKLVPYREEGPKPKPGAWRGKVVIHDDFDEEDEQVTAAFEGRAP